MGVIRYIDESGDVNKKQNLGPFQPLYSQNKRGYQSYPYVSTHLPASALIFVLYRPYSFRFLKITYYPPY